MYTVYNERNETRTGTFSSLRLRSEVLWRKLAPLQRGNARAFGRNAAGAGPAALRRRRGRDEK